VISRRVNSGHPLFIGYGRTGADSPMDHQNILIHLWVRIFCLFEQMKSTLKFKMFIIYSALFSVICYNNLNREF